MTVNELRTKFAEVFARERRPETKTADQADRVADAANAEGGTLRTCATTRDGASQRRRPPADGATVAFRAHGGRSEATATVPTGDRRIGTDARLRAEARVQRRERRREGAG